MTEPDALIADDAAPPFVPPARRPAATTARPRRRIAYALKASAATFVLLAVVAAFALLLFIRRGDVRAARRVAVAELADLLEPGERVEREAYVSQRQWYHYFREMHGILAATDRRLLYVGVEPAALLPRREFEPQAFEEHVWAWDTLTIVERERVYFNTTRGASATGRDGTRAVFAVSGPQLDRLETVAAYAAARRTGVRDQLERERRARLAAEFEARKPRYHTVARGEALLTIAERYNVTPEQLRAWNQLAGDAIRAGQSIMVKPQT